MPENPYGTMLTTPGPGGDWYDPCILADYYYTYEAGNYDADGVWQKGLVWSGGRLCCRLTGVRESTSRLESNGYFSAKNDNNQYYNCVLIGIAPDAFKDQRALDQIEIPETVQRIGEGAFNGCSWLESITIPDSVTYIGSDAFSGTGIQTATMPALAISSIPKTSLKTVVITSGWSIGHHAFEDCKSLTSITIPDSVLSIGDYAFKMCTSLASITIPNSVSSLGQGAFQSCSNLVSINIPDSVTSISNGVFQNCSSLGSIEIQNNVTSIGEYAFDGCSSLKGITIPSSVTTIGFGAIQRCTSLTSITIPFVGHTALNQTSGSYLYRIGYIFGASAGNAADALPESLKEIIVNQGTPFLANQAFAYADRVKTIQIKLADSVKAFCFGRAAFYGCTALETFKLTEASEGVAPILDKLDCLSDSIFANCYYLATIVLPHTKAFAASAYEALQIQTAPVAVDLETPGLPATLIGKGQTADYNIFLQITPPTNIAATNFSIDGLYGNVTINGQTTLKRLASMSSIKTSYEKLADHISYDTPSDFVEALSNISIVGYSPVSVLQMYYSLKLTFNDGTQANVGVQTSTCSAINVLEEDEAGNYVTSTRISYDTSGFLEQIDSVWRPLPLTTVQTLVARRSTGTQAYSTSTIGESFFAYTSARLGSGTVSITAPQRLIHAFMRDTNENNQRLHSVTFSRTADEIEIGGFALCESLKFASYKSIHASDITALADYAFSDCSSLQGFSSEYVNSIGYAAFQQCSSLTTVNLPGATSLAVRSRLADIGDYQSAANSSLAFYNCTQLQTITLAFDGIESLGDYAFAGCGSLQSWGENVPDWKKLKDIGYHAFLNCSKLTALGTLNTVELQNIYFGAFQGCKFTNITVPEVHAEVYTKDNNDSRVTLNYSNFGAFFGAASYSYNSTRVPEQLKAVVVVGGKDIDINAFLDCTSLEEITIPKSVTHIGENAFKDCGKLMSVYIADVAAWYAISFDNAHSNPLSQAENLYLKDTEGNYEKVTELTVPADVKSISNYAFYNYAGLTQITILPNVISIGNSTFQNCKGITFADVPLDYLAVVVSSAEQLSTLTVRTADTSISGTNLASLTNVGTVTTLSIDAQNCTSIANGELKAFSRLTELTIPIIGTSYKATTSSMDSLFNSTPPPDLQKVIITGKYTNIPQQAFQGFSRLTNIQFIHAESTSPMDIGARAFNGCTNLTSIKFGQETPTNISITACESIGDQAFADCRSYSFGSLAWSKKVTIGSSAFKNCTGKGVVPNVQGVTQVTITNSESTIGAAAFAGCPITTVVLPFIGGEKYTWSDAAVDEILGGEKYIFGYIFSAGETMTDASAGVKTANGSYTKFQLPDGLTTIDIKTNIIPPQAFRGLDLSKANTFNMVSTDGTFKIGYAAFYGANKLLDNFIDDNNTWDVVDWTIGSQAFKACTALTGDADIDLKAGENSAIYQQAFYGCTRLLNLTINGQLAQLGEQAFGNCSGIKTFNIAANFQPALGAAGNAFGNDRDAMIKPTQIHAPINFLGTYQGKISLAASSAVGTLEILSNQANTTVPTSLCVDNTALLNVTIDSGVKTIDDQAFSGCTNLASVTFKRGENGAPPQLTTICDSVFSDCKLLASIVIPEGVTAIGKRAFKDCKQLPAAFKLPRGIIQIQDGTFQNCSLITMPEWPSGLTNIGKNAFSGTAIESVILPASLETIGEQAFMNDTKLATLAFNTSLTSVGKKAFYGCPITTVLYPKLANSQCEVCENAFNMSDSVSIKLASDCTIKEWCRMSFKNPSPLTKNMKFFEEDGSQNGRSIVQTFDLLPTDSANFGNYCFWGWKVDQPLVVFWPDDGKTRTLGDGALAINGKVYYYGRDDDACVTPGNTDPNVATEVIPNFGLNSNNKDWETVDSPSPLLQNLSAEIDIKQLEAEYSKFESNLNRLNLTNTNGTTTRTIVGYHVDFTGVTIQVPASQIRVATGNLPGCKRTLFQTEANNGNNTKLTLSIGQYVSISNKSDTAITITFYNADSLSKVFGSLNCTIQDNIANIPTDETMIIAATATATEGE